MAHSSVIGHGGEGNLEVYDYFCNMCKMRVIGAISTTILLCIFKWPALYSMWERKTSVFLCYKGKGGGGTPLAHVCLWLSLASAEGEGGREGGNIPMMQMDLGGGKVEEEEEAGGERGGLSLSLSRWSHRRYWAEEGERKDQSGFLKLFHNTGKEKARVFGGRRNIRRIACYA